MAGVADPRRFDVLRTEFEFERGRIEKLSKEQAMLQKSLIESHLELVQEAVTQGAALNRLLVPIVGFVRAELELPFNKTHYTEIVKRVVLQQGHNFDEFIREIAEDGRKATAGDAKNTPGQDSESPC